MASWDRARVERLHMVLTDTEDDGERGSVHLELARMAISDGRVELAVRHLGEALILDLHLEHARTLLHELTEGTIATLHTKSGPRATLRKLVNRVRKPRSNRGESAEYRDGDA